MINMPASFSSTSASKEPITPQVDRSGRQDFNNHLQAKKNQSKADESGGQDEVFKDKEPKVEAYLEQLGSVATDVKFGGSELEGSESDDGPTVAMFLVDQVGVGNHAIDASISNTTESAQVKVLAVVIEEALQNANDSRLTATQVNLGDNLPIENVLLTKGPSGCWAVQLTSNINAALFSSAQLNQLKDRLKQIGCEIESIRMVSKNDLLVEKIVGQGGFE